MTAKKVCDKRKDKHIKHIETLLKLTVPLNVIKFIEIKASVGEQCQL